MEDTPTLQDVIVEAGIVMITAPELNRADGLMSDQKGSSHWIVTLSSKKTLQTMVLHFTQGAAHKGHPKLKDILSCCQSDANSVEGCGSFEDWAQDMGYDPDSRQAEKIYNACVKEREDLQRVLGDQAFQMLMKVEDQ